MSFVLGLDIGYSNLKLVFGDKSKNETYESKILPVGAADASLVQHQLVGARNDNSVMVNIDGRNWVAGVEPYRLQGWDRELHQEYPGTDNYRALFYAALLLTGQSTINEVVTGLPVDQYKNKELIEKLIKRLEGEHQITPKRNITVDKVTVVPQPAGAYIDSLYSYNDSEDEIIKTAITDGKMVVIDPGFFSVDWVVLQQGEVRYKSSGTSLKAMSMLIEEMERLIKLDHGASPSMNELESYIREKKEKVLLLGELIELKPYMKTASNTVSKNALTPMKTTMREDGLNVDVVLLAGGGAASYEEAAKEIFPRSRIVVSNDSPLANARGFFHIGG